MGYSRQDFDNHQARKAAWRARERRIMELWPLMSARDIGIELDMTASAVIEAAVKIGLKSRPISARPQ